MPAFTSLLRSLGFILLGTAFFAVPRSFAVTVTAPVGGKITFNVSNSGTAPFTYQWRKDGANIAGATASSLALTNLQGTDAGTYSVVVANAAGSTISDNGTLTVSASLVPPTFSLQPASQTVTAGANVTFTATASGTPAPTYQWKLNGANLTGATSASFTINSVSSGNAGTYTVVATNSAGSVTSNSALLTVNAALVAPSFTTQPSSQTVTAGGSVTFTAAASGTPSPTYQWRKNGTAISGATSASYTISAASSSDAATYTVVASNSAGSITSSGATLTVTAVTFAPSFTTQPVSQTIAAGSSVTFTAAASGSPTPTYKWRKNGKNISGANSASYTISAVATADAGSYTVTASNSAGSVTSNTATLTVATAPQITSQPVSTTVTAGSSVTFTVAAAGSPTPSYQWKKNGSAISGATNASYTIASATSGDAATYTVVVSNTAGSVTSTGASLTVNSAPVFTTSPSSQTVTAGASVTFTAAASGSPAPSYQWKLNGANITGATNASYTIASASAANAGSYTVVATNSVGSVTSGVATLTVTAVTIAPSITTQPAGLTVSAGNSATFTVVASGTPAPTYQWKKNGADIAGATGATYTIANVTSADAANYWVVVTNSAGSVTSGGAILTVNAAPAITSQPVSQTVTSGKSFIFSVTATGSPAPTYQWRKNGAAITGATNATYSVSSAVATDAGTYSVVVANAAGSVTSADAVLTVNVDATPVITQQPPSQAVTSNATVTFKVVATGSGTLTYQWKKNGTNISGATNASYTLSNVSSSSTGTFAVVVTNAAGSVTSNDAVLTLRPAAPSAAVRIDFNSDGQGDIVWQDDNTGQVRIDLMGGATVVSSATVTPDSSKWILVGTGDFNGDNRTDFIWMDSVTGNYTVWFMAGTSKGGDTSLSSPGTDWTLAATGDFNKDGRTDLVWQNRVTGERRVWEMNGVSMTNSVSLGTVSLDWEIVGAGDFNNDGRSDLLWQNVKTGDRSLWLMTSSSGGTSVSLGTVGLDWDMVGAGDFDGDNASDIIWQNPATGERSIWFMNGTTRESSIMLPTAPINWDIRN